MDEFETRRPGNKRPLGLIDSLRAMVGTLLQLVHTRVELFTTELEEEMHRVAKLLLWSIVAVFFGGLFVLMLAMTVVIAFWDDHRLFAAIAMSCVFLLIVVVATLVVRSKITARTPFLAHTIAELKRDRETLQRDREP